MFMTFVNVAKNHFKVLCIKDYNLFLKSQVLEHNNLFKISVVRSSHNSALRYVKLKFVTVILLT